MLKEIIAFDNKIKKGFIMSLYFSIIKLTKGKELTLNAKVFMQFEIIQSLNELLN